MKVLSVGEETLALHLRANKIDFEREQYLIPGRSFRVDFFIRSVGLVVEIEGGTWQIGRHQRPKGFEDDAAKYNTLTIAGYSILRYTTEMVQRGEAIRDIVQVLGASRTRKGEKP